MVIVKAHGFVMLLCVLCYVFIPTFCSDASICSTLASSPVVSSVPMRDYLISQGKKVEFDNPVFLVTLSSGIKAVFKPCQEGEDLKDFYAEVAAYKASEFMGFDFVPPTIMRTIDGQTGSLQLFVETSIDPLAPGVFSDILAHIDDDDLANLKLFYFIFGQWDTGPHNMLCRSEGNSIKLIAIDNSGIANRQYVRYGEFPFVRVYYNEKFDTQDKERPFPFDTAQHADNPTEQELNVRFNGCVPSQLCKRLARHRNICYVIYQNSLWIQFHADSDNCEKSFTKIYPPATIKKLEQLTMKNLKEQIFVDAINSPLLNNTHLYAILERRDQVLAHYHSLQTKNDNNCFNEGNAA